LTTDIRQPLAPNPTDQDLRRLLAAQRTAFQREGPPSTAMRRDRIDRLTLALLDSTDDLTAALSADFGNRPEYASLAMDIGGVLIFIQALSNQFESWMRDEVVAGSAARGMPTVLQHRPKGVVGVIGPWNFPVSLVVQPAAEALAAGNRVMIKFSHLPERTAEVFAAAVAAHLDPDEVTVIRGGLDTARAFSTLAFDHIFFTGSAAVGRQVAATAGANLVPVTLGLGGKNPAIVAADADLAAAAERIAANRLINGGQVCLCPDYALVPADRLDAFVDAYRDAVRHIFPTYLANPDVTTIVNDARYRRVIGLVEDAVAKGATAITMVAEDERDRLPDPATRRIPPTVLLGVTDDMAVADEEIFGPVIAVLPYDDVDAAIHHVTARPHPLVAYWYGEDSPDYQEFLRRSNSGGVDRNDIALHMLVAGVPFGGIGPSGMGYYHGRAGFDTFTHQRAITTTTLPYAVASTLVPPFPEETRTAARDGVQAALEHLRASRADGLSAQRVSGGARPV
jgi:coniferyl-aldehyde dehydrogenase